MSISHLTLIMDEGNTLSAMRGGARITQTLRA